MHLDQNERRIFTEYEERRELAEVGLSGDVECSGCGSATGTVVVLLGLTRCPDCAMSAALHLRYHDDEWSALTRHDQVEALEVIETQAQIERMALVRRTP